jgi:multisubunit Na+/H+ antiporter MnhE subunit
MITPAVPIVILVLGAVLGWFIGADLQVPRATLAGFLFLWVVCWTTIAVVLSLERGRDTLQYLVDARGYHRWMPRTWYLQARPEVIATVVATGVMVVQIAQHVLPFLWHRTIEKIHLVMAQRADAGDFSEKTAGAAADFMAWAGLIAVGVLTFLLWLVIRDGWREFLIRVGLARTGTRIWLQHRLIRAICDRVQSAPGSARHRRTMLVLERLIALLVVMTQRGRFCSADLAVVESAVFKHFREARGAMDPVLFQVFAEVHAAVGPHMQHSTPGTVSLVIA